MRRERTPWVETSIRSRVASARVASARVASARVASAEAADDTAEHCVDERSVRWWQPEETCREIYGDIYGKAWEVWHLGQDGVGVRERKKTHLSKAWAISSWEISSALVRLARVASGSQTALGKLRKYRKSRLRASAEISARSASAPTLPTARLRTRSSSGASSAAGEGNIHIGRRQDNGRDVD